jgi:cyanophycinase
MKYAVCLSLFSLFLGVNPAYAQVESVGPANGTLLLTGGGPVEPGKVLDTFLELAGGEGSPILFIRIPQGLPKNVGNRAEYEAILDKRFRGEVTLLHSDKRADWNSAEFTAAIRAANAVWVSGGEQGHLANLVLDTRSHMELEALLERGGVYAGQSGGAMIATSFMLRGSPNKPALISRGHTRGFGFLRDVVVNPHLTKWNRENQLVTAIDLYPDLLGIAIDEGAAIMVRQDRFRIVGDGRVAIYDNELHGSKWLYDLDPDAVFDLNARAVLKPE